MSYLGILSNQLHTHYHYMMMDISYITSTNEHIHLHTLTYTSYLFRDNREKMKELTDKERSEIQEAEEARSSFIIQIFTCTIS